MHRRELIDESHSQTAYPPPTHKHVHAHPQTDQDLMSHSRFSQSITKVGTDYTKSNTTKTSMPCFCCIRFNIVSL